MATLGEIKARVARELDRDDLTTVIADAINRAIEFYADQRFKWTEDTATVTTTADVETVALPDGLRYEDHYGVFIEVGGFKYPLYKIPRVDMQYWQSTQDLVGQPVEYAIESGELRLFPTPNQAYTITILGVYNVAAPASDSASNAWTTQGEDLIVARARYTIARDVTYDPDMVASAQAAMTEALRRLKGEASRQLTNMRLEPNW